MSQMASLNIVIEQPECCLDCQFCVEAIYCAVTNTSIVFDAEVNANNMRMPDCPLVPVEILDVETPSGNQQNN